MKTPHWIAIGVTVAAAVWILSGQFGESKNKPAVNTERLAAAQQAALLPRVRVRTMTATAREREVVVNGHTEASRKVELRAETKGRVIAIGAERGDRVKKGALIVRLAVDDREARKREAAALLGQRQIEAKAARTLSAKGFRSDIRVAEAQALLESAQAALTRIEVEIDNTTVNAPFAGILESRAVEVGHYLEAGKPIALLVDLDPIKVAARVAERDAALILPGMTGTARLVTGEVILGVVTYVSTVSDERTRTFRVELEIDNPDSRLVEGTTTELRLAVSSEMAHFVSPAILILSADGRLGVKIVDADQRVRFMPATIIGDQADGVWLSGLPRTATIITVGQESVAEGEKVIPVPEVDSPSADDATRQAEPKS